MDPTALAVLLLLLLALGGGGYWAYKKGYFGKKEDKKEDKEPESNDSKEDASPPASVPTPPADPWGAFGAAKKGYDTSGHDFGCKLLTDSYTIDDCRDECANNVDCVAINEYGTEGDKRCCPKKKSALEAYNYKPQYSGVQNIKWWGKKSAGWHD